MEGTLLSEVTHPDAKAKITDIFVAKTENY